MNFDVKDIGMKFDYSELRNYYNNLSSNYEHLKFTNVEDTVDSEKHHTDGVFGWGIQSNLSDLTIPCPPWNVHKERSDEYRDTELVFGIILKLKMKYPNARQIGISGHPPGTLIQQHTDTDKYVKIHMPILTNPKAVFLFGNRQYSLKVGHAYLINTTRPHGTYNGGDTNRVHLLFKVPTEEYYETT